MSLGEIITNLPLTRGLDVVRLYISTRYGVNVREFDFDCRQTWNDNFADAGFSDNFLYNRTSVQDFEFCIVNESLVLEIQVVEKSRED